MAAIRYVVHAASQSIGFTKAKLSARSLCAGVGMALLVAWVDPDTTRLVVRWQSDIMLCYLHTTAKSFTEVLATILFSLPG